MTLDETIRAAITNKSAMTLTRSQDRAFRLVCPHAYGFSDAGELNVFCYQYGGYSSQPLAEVGSPKNWRCYCVKDIVSAELIDDEWHTAYGQTRPSSCVRRQILSLL